MNQGNERYVYGTAAEKLQYNIYEENKVLKEKKRYRSNNRVKLKVIGTCLLIFSACFLLIFRYAVITKLNYDVSKAEKAYNVLRNDNSRLKVQIEEELDLTQLKTLAVERLGMKEPDKMQIVYLKVPKYDVTVVSEDRKDSKQSRGSVAAVILEKAGKFVALLY